jgi:uncharacterized membrane protein
MGVRDPRTLLVVILLSSAAGFVFSAVSTYDSIAHLDRQMHGVHCTYLLGLGSPGAGGDAGCRATLMSPYSSVFRQSIWGGVPVAVPSMSVFAFIFFAAAALALARREGDPHAAGFLLAAALLPLLSSLVMGYLSFVTLQAACKLCIGIYVASAALFAAAYALWATVRARPAESKSAEGGRERSPRPWAVLAWALALGVLFVALPVGIYAAAAPDFSRYAGNCGSLERTEDPQRALLPLGPQDRSVAMIEVIDPLCASCGAFDVRFRALSLSAQVSRRILLFPLDKSCNWMIGESVNPGACAVSEAVLCAEDRAQQVLDWAFRERETIVEKARGDPGAVGRMISKRFPGLKKCVGSARARARLNHALRWTVKNRLQVLTPQVYVNGLRLCDEDTDLGLDYSLPRLIARAGSRPVPEREPTQRKAVGRRIKESVEKGPGPLPSVEPAGAVPAPGPAAPGIETDRKDASVPVEPRPPAPGIAMERKDASIPIEPRQPSSAVEKDTKEESTAVEKDTKEESTAVEARDKAVEPTETEVKP